MTRSTFALPRLFGSALALAVLSTPAGAAVFCVNNATALQTALTTAASNGEDDQIQIVQGAYIGNFVYASTQANDLAVQGGWTAGCASRVIDPTNTVLDGNRTGTVLALSAPNVAADLLLHGVTLRNGLRTTGSGGGGLYAAVGSGGQVTVTANQILANEATNSSYSGGGVYVDSDYGDVTLTHNLIQDNSSYSSGGGVSVSSYGAVTLTHNQIQDNNSYSGGGVYVYSNEGDVTLITHNLFQDNTAQQGGGLYVHRYYGLISLVNNSFHGNEANTSGGGAYLYLYSDEDRVSAALYNNLFWHNIATGAQGADLWIENDPDGDFLAAPVLFSHNSFDQSTPSGFYSQLPITIDPSNLDRVDPRFVDAANGDLRLLTGSPMIDAGDPATPDLPEFDLAGNPRVVGSAVDIGAYEHDGSDPGGVLFITPSGTGGGTITSDPEGIDCGTDCSHAFVLGTPVTLTGTPDATSVFDGWSGDADCTDGQLTMDGNRACTATFNAVRQLTVTKAGEGDGTLTSDPAGIDCGAACSAYFYLNEIVDLTATPDAWSLFTGWSGAGDCTDGQVRMSANLGCTATFDPIRYTLLVLLPGTGTGTVTSDPAGIDCGSDCREDYAALTRVTLTAAADPGSVFNGWAGACSGQALSCEVQITEMTGVTANFTALLPTTDSRLHVSTQGGGVVTSTPEGIDCGSQCAADFNPSTRVTLTPTPNDGLTFNGWLGACTGTGVCQVAMTQDATVMATFGAHIPSQHLVLQNTVVTGTQTHGAPRTLLLGPDLRLKAGSSLSVTAGEGIRFLPGFVAELGARFAARIDPSVRPQ